MKSKFYFPILFILSIQVNIQAQNTLAKFKFEDAEKAFNANNYEECLKLLDETEEILGQSAPNIVFLKILAGHKLLEADENYPFSLLATVRDQTSLYLTNYDIAGLEDKYKQVYEVSNALKAYPENEQAFNRKREAITKANQTLKTVIENYINTIGGLEIISTMKSIYKVSLPFVENGKEYQVEKVMLPDKISYSGAELKSLERPLGSYIVNGNYGVHVIKPNNPGKKGPGPIKGLTAAEYSSMKNMLRIGTIPEKSFFEVNYQLSYEGIENGLHKIHVIYPGGVEEIRYYNDSTKLLEKIQISGDCLVKLSKYMNFTSMEILYENYKPVDGILMPFDITYIGSGNFNDNVFKDQRVWASSYSEISINENVGINDFYLANSYNAKPVNELQKSKDEMGVTLGILNSIRKKDN